jgi:hypothetical protein
MGKKISHRPPISAGQPTHVQSSAKMSASLQASRKKTLEYIFENGGKKLFGAGHLGAGHQFTVSKAPPSSKIVNQAVSGSLLPKTKHK